MYTTVNPTKFCVSTMKSLQLTSEYILFVWLIFCCSDPVSPQGPLNFNISLISHCFLTTAHSMHHVLKTESEQNKIPNRKFILFILSCHFKQRKHYIDYLPATEPQKLSWKPCCNHPWIENFLFDPFLLLHDRSKFNRWVRWHVIAFTWLCSLCFSAIISHSFTLPTPIFSHTAFRVIILAGHVQFLRKFGGRLGQMEKSLFLCTCRKCVSVWIFSHVNENISHVIQSLYALHVWIKLRFNKKMTQTD